MVSIDNDNIMIAGKYKEWKLGLIHFKTSSIT